MTHPIISNELDEDLLQIEYGNYIIDVGCYPTPLGNMYKGVIIKDQDWDNPVEEMTTLHPNMIIAWVNSTNKVYKEKSIAG